MAMGASYMANNNSSSRTYVGKGLMKGKDCNRTRHSWGANKILPFQTQTIIEALMGSYIKTVLRIDLIITHGT